MAESAAVNTNFGEQRFPTAVGSLCNAVEILCANLGLEIHFSIAHTDKRKAYAQPEYRAIGYVSKVNHHYRMFFSFDSIYRCYVYIGNGIKVDFSFAILPSFESSGTCLA